jgi:hypothetical protein
VAEWLRNGLQNRVPRFNSGRGLHEINYLARKVTGQEITVSVSSVTSCGHRPNPIAAALELLAPAATASQK